MSKLYPSWFSRVPIQLPSGCWIALWTSESEKHSGAILYRPNKNKSSNENQNKKGHPIFGESPNIDQIKKHHVSFINKEAYTSNQLQLKYKSI